MLMLQTFAFLCLKKVFFVKITLPVFFLQILFEVFWGISLTKGRQYFFLLGQCYFLSLLHPMANDHIPYFMILFHYLLRFYIFYLHILKHTFFSSSYSFRLAILRDSSFLVISSSLSFLFLYSSILLRV